MISKPKHEASALIPINIEYRTIPCVWNVEKTTVKKTLDPWGGRRRPQERFFFRNTSGSQPVNFDPWSVRELFLSLETEADFLRFLNRVGTFSASVGSGDWELKDFKGWQEVFREFLRRAPATWERYLAQLNVGTPRFNAPLISFELRVINDARFQLRFVWEEDLQSGIIRVRHAASAILATILVDRLRGASFRFCARHDCRKPFEVKSKHERKYCSQYCGHLESLRRMRERQKRERR